MTSGRREWTGLDTDNNVVEPLNRRGPRPLPLKLNEWNRLIARPRREIDHADPGTMCPSTSGRSTGPAIFGSGCTRHRASTGAQIRKVVLTGDWPETVPHEFLEDPTLTVGAPLPTADRHALNLVFGDDFLSENVFAVRRRALALSPVERFEFLLAARVFPGKDPDHAGFRVTSDFTPTRPPPVALEPDTAEPELGGRIVSPVYDWLDTARELGRLAECRRRVEAARVDVSSDLDPQARATGVCKTARRRRLDAAEHRTG